MGLVKELELEDTIPPSVNDVAFECSLLPALFFRWFLVLHTCDCLQELELGMSAGVMVIAVCCLVAYRISSALWSICITNTAYRLRLALRPICITCNTLSPSIRRVILSGTTLVRVVHANRGSRAFTSCTKHDNYVNETECSAFIVSEENPI